MSTNYAHIGTSDQEGFRLKALALEDIDRFGPLDIVPMPLSSTAWKGDALTTDDIAALERNARLKLAPRLEELARSHPLKYLAALAALRPFIFD